MRSKLGLLAFLLFCSVLLCTGHGLHSPAQAFEQGMKALADTHQVVVPGTSVDTEDDDLPEDDTPSALLLPTSPDTLRTYTLTGQRICGQRKNLRTHTLYNMVIKNGRKVLR